MADITGSISPNSQNAYTTYIVNPGDSLQSISLQFYGGTGGAKEIYIANANKIHNPLQLSPGTVLQIPSLGNYSTLA